MYTVDIAQLERARTLEVDQSIPTDDPLWQGSDLAFKAAVDVHVSLSSTGSGQLIGRGQVRALLAHTCRRCLQPVEVPMDQVVELVWSVPDQLADPDEASDEIRVLEPDAGKLDLGEAIREEVLLSAPRYVLCAEDCRGICARCGTNRNERDCDCEPDEPDPRWDALRKLGKE